MKLILSVSYLSIAILLPPPDKSLNESVATIGMGIGIGLFATVWVSTFAIIAGSIINAKKDYDMIKKSIDVYPKLYTDCKPLYKFKKKICEITPYTDKPGEESVPKSRIEKFMRKHKLDYGNKCVCYFEDGKLAMYYVYRQQSRGEYTTYSIKTFICDDKFKKHQKYYITNFLFDRGMTNNDCINWAKKIVKEYDSNNKKGD